MVLIKIELYHFPLPFYPSASPRYSPLNPSYGLGFSLLSLHVCVCMCAHTYVCMHVFAQKYVNTIH